MLEQRVQQQFFESADLQYECAEASAREVAAAAQALFTTFTAGGRVLVHGAGLSQVLALHLHALLIGPFERDRPALAALLLGAGLSASLAASQVHALAQAGDCLVLLDDPASTQAGEQELACVQAAHLREANVLVLTRARASWWGPHLLETDVLLRVPHERVPRVLEAHLLVLHALCDALDTQLLGEQDP
jgi:D-sedoheptulose 7-phosphate isomerase